MFSSEDTDHTVSCRVYSQNCLSCRDCCSIASPCNLHPPGPRVSVACNSGGQDVLGRLTVARPLAQPLPPLCRYPCAAPLWQLLLQTCSLAVPFSQQPFGPPPLGLNSVLQQPRGWGPDAWADRMPTRQEKRRARQNQRLRPVDRHAARAPSPATVHEGSPVKAPGTSTSAQPVEDVAQAIREALLADTPVPAQLGYEPSQHPLTVPDLRLLTYVKWPGRPPPTTVYLKALRARPDKPLKDPDVAAAVEHSTSEAPPGAALAGSRDATRPGSSSKAPASFFAPSSSSKSGPSPSRGGPVKEASLHRPGLGTRGDH